MKRSEATHDVLDVMQALWALAHALEARSKRMHRDIGITGPQRLLLRVVGQSPGCGPGAAARRLSLDPGTVTRLAAGLEKRKLLLREVDRWTGASSDSC
jgi:DNA-binding MarR family transcriptional regulator